ncbi:MAG: DUF4173 domain-containing protein [Coriobacteriia bacterium]|nr:DUF4173 domain-containing protein [Coriobacteriia bacterium]
MKKYSIWLCAAFGSIALVELFFFSPPALGWTLFFLACIGLYFLCFGVQKMPKAIDWILIASIVGLALPFVLFNNSALRWFNFIAIGLCLLVLFLRRIAPEDAGWDKLAFYGEVFAGSMVRPFAYLVHPWRAKKKTPPVPPVNPDWNFDPNTGQPVNATQTSPDAQADCPFEREKKIKRRKTIAAQVALALLVSVPLLSVLGTFLYHSDPVFASLVDAVVRFIVNLNIGTIILHASIMAVIFPFVLSFFWSYGKAKFITLGKGVYARSTPPNAAPSPNPNPSYDANPNPSLNPNYDPNSNHSFSSDPYTGTVAPPIPDNKRNKFKFPSIFSATLLLMVNLLYFVYALVQFRFLFAGTSGTLPEGLGLIYADYARSGFFELVTLALFNFALIAISAYFTHREGRAGLVLRSLTIALVALSTIQLASALTRMLLYVQAFGLSQLRLFVFAYITFIAIVFVLFIVRELLSKRATPLFRIAALSALVLLLGMNYIVPDTLIARYNLERQIAGELKVQRVDFNYYAYHLSFDSVRVLLEMEDRLLDARPELQPDFDRLHGALSRTREDVPIMRQTQGKWGYFSSWRAAGLDEKESLYTVGDSRMPFIERERYDNTWRSFNLNTQRLFRMID